MKSMKTWAGNVFAGPSWTLRFFLYFFGLGYMFCGVGVVSDIFMNAIEEITSKTVKKVNPASGEFVRVKVWNATVANLTLMALGSSAPEILLSIIELLGNEMYSGELGPSTIVGSAAFNLLCIIAVCISAIPPGEVRKIKELPVFVVTTTFSIFAYVWLLFILLVTSPSIVEIWEGVFTFIFFWMLISIAYMADRGYFGFRIEDDEDDDEDAPIRTRVISAELSAEDLAKIQSQLLQVHGRHLSDDELIKLIEEERSNQMPRKETQTDMRKVAPLDIESQAPSCIVGKGLEGMEDVTPPKDDAPTLKSSWPIAALTFWLLQLREVQQRLTIDVGENDEPYLGALIAACLHQRGQRIRETALHLARQAAVLMIENLGAYSKSLDNQDVESLAAARVKNDRLDPLIYHALFDKVHKGIHPNLAKSKEEFKVAMRDSQLLMVSQICLAITMFSCGQGSTTCNLR
ncbi:unnamed protein product [Cladocopium goreaui]|uniref:Sodium/calcium exchanger 1 (Na(+)/Ca(2+)-exchange protein 1) (Solute carrier family 8 member 1) n=1 Tax=Cladocopium goreaui TaxID=2562237 RepID=A0A9P1BJ64_9DINO|nr:unnamed protein product [Cladocopium goreaui]